MILKGQPPPDRAGLSAELRLPERVAQHYPRRGTSGLIVRRSQQPSGGRLDSQCGEEVSTHFDPGHVSGLGPFAENEAVTAAIPRQDLRKCLLLPSNFSK